MTSLEKSQIKDAEAATAGTLRFTFGVRELPDGLGLVPVALGMFGLAEVIDSLASSARTESREMEPRGLRVRAGETTRALRASLRGTFLGALLGIVPGGGPSLASFA